MKKHTILKSKFNSAFSLVELLVVIAVIAIIAAIAIPNITGARQSADDGKWISDKATVERRIAEAREATGTTPTIAQVIDGSAAELTNRGFISTNQDTQTRVQFYVETAYDAASLAETLPPSQRAAVAP
jgi:prepilin-type N-terminal cleavage/methylation domain-containing protein